MTTPPTASSGAPRHSPPTSPPVTSGLTDGPDQNVSRDGGVGYVGFEGPVCCNV